MRKSCKNEREAYFLFFFSMEQVSATGLSFSLFLFFFSPPWRTAAEATIAAAIPLLCANPFFFSPPLRQRGFPEKACSQRIWSFFFFFPLFSRIGRACALLPQGLSDPFSSPLCLGFARKSASSKPRSRLPFFFFFSFFFPGPFSVAIPLTMDLAVFSSSLFLLPWRRHREDRLWLFLFFLFSSRSRRETGDEKGT